MKQLALIALCLSLFGCASTRAESDIDTSAIAVDVITWNAASDSVWSAGLPDSVSNGVPVRSNEKPTVPGQYIYTLRIDTTYEQITVDLYRRVIDTVETWGPKPAVPATWLQYSMPEVVPCW